MKRNLIQRVISVISAAEPPLFGSQSDKMAFRENQKAITEELHALLKSKEKEERLQYAQVESSATPLPGLPG